MISCDPGASGAIAIIRLEDNSTAFLPNSKPILKLYEALQSMKEDYHIVGIGLEKVHAIPGTSAGSNFKFGFNYGVVSTLLSTLGVAIYDIPPKEWQKFIGLSIPRGLSTNLRKKRIKLGVGNICNRLYPKAEIYGIRGGLRDGRSDALMIGHTVLHKFKLGQN